MPKIAKPLGPLAVSRIVVPGQHAVGGVAGLHLVVAPTGARSWILRIVVGENIGVGERTKGLPVPRRREIGLGAYPAVGLADARARATALREEVRQGVDPLLKRWQAESTLRAAQRAGTTFRQAVESYVKAHAPEWKNPKHRQQWENTMAQHAYPLLGDLDVAHIDAALVLKVLEPIWLTTTETAKRLRGRIEQVLAAADTLAKRERPNPARWRNHLDKLLPAPGKVAKVEHFAAVPVPAVGAFMRDLRLMPGLAAQALRFAILTAARSGEVRGATWAEIDLQTGLWTVPGERIKAGKEHRVPLAPQVLDLLRALPEGRPGDLVFPAPRGGQLSDMTLTAVLRRMEVKATAHGFRSTFRDWAAERTHYPREMAEMALAHAVGDKVEAAYRRGDMLEKRRGMMVEWAQFLDRIEQPAQIIELAQRRAV